MDTHIDGSLDSWNDERGFGFITATRSGEKVFVHISAFPRDGSRPTLGESLSFEVELNPEEKKTRDQCASHPSRHCS